MAYRLKVNNTK